ncbi:unnamed protein product [Sphacelaria rigidula]
MVPYNVRTLLFVMNNRAGHADVVLQKCREVGCDVIELQEKRRPGQTEVAAARHHIFCGGAEGGKGRAGQHGVGLVVKGSTINKTTWTQALISECFMSITSDMAGQSNAVTFVAACAPADMKAKRREIYVLG